MKENWEGETGKEKEREELEKGNINKKDKERGKER